MDTLFSLSSSLVLPFWLAMILAPGWRWTQRILRSPLSVGALAAVYAALVVPRLFELLPLVAQPRLATIATLLGTSDGATIAWVHFLAFDLFVGRWAYLDSRERGITAWLMAPVLALTLLFGPLGFLAYLGVRGLSNAGALTAARTPRPLIRRLWRANRALTVVGALMAATLVATLIGLVIDPRVITGAPAWLKPTKFAISTSIYAFTLVWLLSFIRGHSRLVSFIANASAVALTIEVAIIVLQVVRGTTSHFNFSTPLDAALFQVMGGFIVLVWLLAAVTATLLVRQELPDAVLAWSLRLGLLIALVGMAVAFFMTRPTSDQQAVLAAASGPVIIGAHSVGVSDGGPGLPLVGWSTVGGDLRVAHFVGLHALQALPLLGWLLGRQQVRLDTRHRLVLLWTAGAAYLGLVVLLAWQALRGQPLIAPDATTLIALALLFGAAGLSALATLIHARRSGAVVRRAQGRRFHLWWSPSQ